MRARALVVALALVGCAGAPVVKRAVAVGADVLVCAQDSAAQVRSAITGGGTDWLGIVIGLFPCIESVVHDLTAEMANLERGVRANELAGAYAQEGDALAQPLTAKLSKGARKRLAAAKVLGEVLNRAVKP